MTWYKTGNEGAETAKQHDTDRQNRSNAPRRVWVPVDASVQFTFLDTEGLGK